MYASTARFARFNRHVTNPVARAALGWVPGFGILEHAGRKSGKRYRTPLLVFESTTNFLVCIGYGEQSDWLKDVKNGGETAIRRRGPTVKVAEPQLMSKADGARYLTSDLVKLRYRMFPYDEAALVLTKLTD